MKKQDNRRRISEIIAEEIMEIPKISFGIAGIGFLIILYSFINLRNPFFMVVGVFAGICFIFFGYDYWWKKLADKRIERLTQRLDNLLFEVYKKEEKQK